MPRRIAITGEKGFIARNLAWEMGNVPELCFVSLRDDPELSKVPETGEPCVWRNSSEVWTRVLRKHRIDLLVNTAAVVNSDVVDGSKDAAHRTNVAGALNISVACEAAQVDLIHLGTTVGHVNQRIIDESTPYCGVESMTLYGQQKSMADSVVKASGSRWMILRPMFCFGGVGDSNSMISKLCYVAEGGDLAKKFLCAAIRLHPDKKKQWMTVRSFCDAVIAAMLSNLWGREFFISSGVDCGIAAGEVARMCGVDESQVRWLPETDYLGNHVCSSLAFQEAVSADRGETIWRPETRKSLQKRIDEVRDSYRAARETRSAFNGSGFNPLVIRKYSTDE